MRMTKARRIGIAVLVVSFLLMAVAVGGLAQEEGEAGTTGAGLKALGAGLAFLGGALGTGLAQSRAVAAVVGSVAEDPGQLGVGILLIVIPETLVILGFVALFIL